MILIISKFLMKNYFGSFSLLLLYKFQYLKNNVHTYIIVSTNIIVPAQRLGSEFGREGMGGFAIFSEFLRRFSTWR